MSTPHNKANIGDIAKTVIMPGDPLRAKYIADNFLDNVKLVNDVRGMLAYTGTFKGKKLTIMASGMGMPSMGIYSYELYKFYNVENIIRIGSCGSYIPDLKLFDIILAEKVFTESNFALTLNNEVCHLVESNENLNTIINNTAEYLNLKIHVGNIICSDCFDVYMTDVNKFLDRVPKDFNPSGAEMESFALFYIAKLLNKKASCIASIVDSKYIKNIATAKERETGLNNMILIALNSSINF